MWAKGVHIYSFNTIFLKNIIIMNCIMFEKNVIKISTNATFYVRTFC